MKRIGKINCKVDPILKNLSLCKGQDFIKNLADVNWPLVLFTVTGKREQAAYLICVSLERLGLLALMRPEDARGGSATPCREGQR